MKILSIPILLASSVALAQDKADQDQVTELEALTIESTPLGTSVNEASQAWSVLSGDDLEKSKSGTIAESLSKVPGVSQSYFGPSANRPIIRGLDKNRVRMLQNGIDTFDVSAQSEDHAIPVDPMFIERIEILRGSSALLHGGSAIGGVVNVIDRSIPTSPYSSPGASLRSSYTSVNDGWNYGAMAFGGSDSLNFQINGFKREYEDYDSPIGKIANSHGESSSIGLGGSHIWESGYAGLSFSSYENTYGVPGEHAELDTRIELESDRFEVRSEIDVTGSDWLTGIELNFGFGDYTHAEIGKHHEEHDDDHGDDDHEDELHTHATYFREGIESRIGLKHEIGGMKGIFGFHGLFDELSIAGDESIFSGDTNSSNAVTSDKINNEEAQKLSLFLIEEFELSENTLINGGIRWEGLDREFATFKHDDNTTGSRELDDSTFNASFGVTRKLNEIWSLSSNLTYSERAPDSSELFAFGPHHATEAFEIGDSSLDKETAVGIEVILRRTMGKVTGQLSAFHTEIDNYIFLEHGEAPAGVDTDGLGVLEYHSAKVEFQGLEAELDWLAMENEGWSLLLSSYGDVLRGKNKSENAHLPRIAPARIGVGFEIQADKFRFGMNLDHVFKQNRISVHEEEDDHGDGDDHGDDDEHDEHEHGETATAAYSLLNAYAAYDLNIGDSEGELFVRGYNLTDELARVHTSFLKSSAPLPGANVEIGLKFDF